VVDASETARWGARFSKDDHCLGVWVLMKQNCLFFKGTVRVDFGQAQFILVVGLSDLAASSLMLSPNW
jgi:hypothetical protein